MLEQKIPFYYIKVRNVNAMEQGTAKLDMLHGSIWDKLLRFALPVAATAALGQLFNAADVAVVGNFASGSRTAAVAAVGHGQLALVTVLEARMQACHRC